MKGVDLIVKEEYTKAIRKQRFESKMMVREGIFVFKCKLSPRNIVVLWYLLRLG